VLFRSLELTLQIKDLVPEARTALAGELHRRGQQPADIEKYAAEQQPPEKPVAGAEMEMDGDGQDRHFKEGPVPEGWKQIPSFSIDESYTLSDHMAQNQIPYKITFVPGSNNQRCYLHVPGNELDRCIGILKECYELTDEHPELYTGNCPACGTKLESVPECTDCGLGLYMDAWEARKEHPFVKFLIQNGHGRK